MICDICQNEIETNMLSGWDQGNNGEPITTEAPDLGLTGRVCDGCDSLVIEARIYSVDALYERIKETANRNNVLKIRLMFLKDTMRRLIRGANNG